MTFLIRHLLLAGDPQRYSEIPPSEECCLDKVPLDLLDTTSEIDEFSRSSGSYDKAIVGSELGGFSMQAENGDVSRCNSELTGFGVQEANSDAASCVSEVSEFLLETVT